MSSDTFEFALRPIGRRTPKEAQNASPAGVIPTGQVKVSGEFTSLQTGPKRVRGGRAAKRASHRDTLGASQPLYEATAEHSGAQTRLRVLNYIMLPEVKDDTPLRLRGGEEDTSSEAGSESTPTPPESPVLVPTSEDSPPTVQVPEINIDPVTEDAVEVDPEMPKLTADAFIGDLPIFEDTDREIIPSLPMHYATEVPVESYPTEGKDLSRTHRPDFYRSMEGLWRGKFLRHLLPRPTEILANYREYSWDGDTLVGLGSYIQRVHVPLRSKNRTVPARAFETLVAEAVLTHFSRLERDDVDRKLYFRHLRVLNFMRTCVDAVALSYHVIQDMTRLAVRRRQMDTVFHLSSEDRRQIRRFYVRLVAEPLLEARDIKAAGGFARAWFFGEPRRRHWLLRPLTTQYSALLFSYIGRALPPPSFDMAEKEYAGLVERLTSVPPPEHSEWPAFVHRYLTRFKPKSDPEDRNYPTDSSAGACLGYPRHVGGFSMAVRDLVGLGLCLMKTDPDPDDRGPTVRDIDGQVIDFDSILMYHDPEDPFWMMGKRMDGESESRGPIDLETLNYVSRLQVPFQRALFRGVVWVLARVKAQDGIVFKAVTAPEAGLKTRFPTMTLVAVLLVSQLLRRAADMHLVHDRRTSEALGGKLVHSFKDSSKGPWYSQDLTSATDLHPFWLQKTFYERLLEDHPKLKWIRKYLPLLFGPRWLIPARAEIPETPTNPYLPMITGEWKEVLAHSIDTGSRAWRLSSDAVTDEEAQTYIRAWRKWIREVYKLALPIQTTTGNPMGEAASFPLLPVVTAFAAERAGLEDTETCGDDAVSPLTQNGIPKVLQEPEAGLQPKMAAVIKSLPGHLAVCRVDPSRLSEAGFRKLNSDWRKSPKVKLQIFEAAIEECGGVLSRGDPEKGKPNKIFLHAEYNLFKEIPRRRNTPLPFIPTKILVAPPGGSKGTVNWFNQPTAVRQHLAAFPFPLTRQTWSLLPNYPHALAAYSLGIPAREIVAYGGINHPLFDHNAGLNPYTTQKWLSTLTQLKIEDWAAGTGLSPLPSGSSSLARSASKGWLRSLLDRHRAGLQPAVTNRPYDPDLRGSLPDLKESTQKAAAIAESYLLYAHTPEEFNKTPAIKTVVSKFHRQISKGRFLLRKGRRDGKPLTLTYQGTVQDVQKKRDLYLLNPDEELPSRLVSRRYGLIESKFDPDRKPWQWDWLERGIYPDTLIFNPDSVWRDRPVEDPDPP
uniref:RNA-dependent RNA polymerase n=1 Tax=Heterobasidion narna-like virus 3 TaxID=3075972 RepID=A0AA95Z2A5_9VIRU|nr:RNA-dependent RNA polymerase [Heterobasidion narna-like virus 3]